MHLKVGDIVRIKKTGEPGVPYQGRRGRVSEITVYPNGRLEIEVKIESAKSSRYGKPFRNYHLEELIKEKEIL